MLPVCVWPLARGHQRWVRGLPTVAESWHVQDLNVWLWREINPRPKEATSRCFLPSEACQAVRSVPQGSKPGHSGLSPPVPHCVRVQP